jgi:hypothetical protein
MGKLKTLLLTTNKRHLGLSYPSSKPTKMQRESRNKMPLRLYKERERWSNQE